MASKRMGVQRAEDDELRVPLVEERLRIEKRTRSMGEALFRRRVTEERRSAEVDVMREHLRVEQRGLTPRPAGPGEVEGAFLERTVLVPVFGEAAVARKAPYITGEVVVHRRRVAETRALTETLRRERAEVEEVAPPVPERAVHAVEARAPQPAAAPAAPRARPELPGPEARRAPRAVAVPEETLPGLAPVLPIRKVLDDVRAGWARARRAA